MGILKTYNHTKAFKLIGVSVPLWLHNYISLYCLAKKKTKSDVMKGWIDSWYVQTKAKEPQEKLVQEIIEIINEEWKAVLKHNPEKTIEEFKCELEAEMKNRGFNSLQINIILKAVR
jgi:protease II